MTNVAKLKLYHVKLPIDRLLGYDSYSEFVVAAYSEQEARTYYPSGAGQWPTYIHGEWVQKDETGFLLVELIGMATNNVEAGRVIVASYHAG